MTQLYQNNGKKIGLTALILGFLVLLVVLYIQKEKPYYFYENDTRLFLYIILSIASIFTIHSWVLLPKYFQNSIKEYKYWCIGFGMAFIFYFIILFDTTIYPESKDGEIELLSLTISIFLALLIFVNFLYTTFFIKEIRLKFLEFIVNVIAFGVLSGLAISIDKHFIRFIPIVIITFYIHTFLIVPLLVKNKKTNYLLYIFGLIVSYSLGIIGIFYSLIHSFSDFVTTVNFATSILVITLFLSFIYGYFRIKFKNTTVKVETKTSELNLLKSQVNPHFLFNTLNTLYASALNENAPQTAETTAKLANLLRYMENDMKKEHIPITDEMKYIEDYIAIQKTRCSVEPKIEITTQNVSESIRISPGLFIPLVENAFKHGIHLIENATLEIEVSCDAKNIRFTCANSYDESLKVNKMEKGFGIGLQNVRKRLELLYGQHHTFEIKKNNGTFTVNLTIPRI
ncbi:MAG: histidine kinase [Flavobacteriaceae bacterium]|nr:histidine kinase [Flavobacteriaceae bacterium]